MDNLHDIPLPSIEGSITSPPYLSFPIVDEPLNTDPATLGLLKQLLQLTRTHDESARRTVVLSLTNLQLDELVGRMWEQGLSHTVRYMTRVRLDDYQPQMDNETRAWLFGDFAKVKNDVAWLWQQDDEDLQGARCTRLGVLEDLLEDYVSEEWGDGQMVKQRGDAEKSITLPAAIRIMNRSQRMQDRDVMAWKEDRANRLKGLEGDDNLASG